ncbi:hypothetical protein K432DRAFT_383012 [Lepidopterella palustris CBS 459.81]|uniref:CREG-like beta-barrel domain-containing protein n=1 Tax=Lepidopterella palustris CBS 459.81 TaxID=1314670 RepID=A0A8E2E8Z5_9PEZI|nr:hypothetical protein K432DRAFT_383012 [Lepidopterella palustris CBS 459.81]
MRFLTAASISLLIPLSTSTSLPPPQYLFSNPPTTNDNIPSTYRIPTVHESAIQARRILHLESIGTLSTIFPSSSSNPSTLETRPEDVGGAPIGLMDYFADCEPGSGNPTILAISIATSFKNVASGSNITLSLRWHPPFSHIRPRPVSPASLPRFSLIGQLQELSIEEAKAGGVAECFVKYHPDAVAWLPGNKIHESKWVRLVVEELYWIGGFGDRAYIGWIPVDEWKGVTQEEVEKCRLPGESRKGWMGEWWDMVAGTASADKHPVWEL